MRSPYSAVVILPLAHLLHWYFMPLYAAPMLIVLYSTIKETIRQRRESEDEEAEAEQERRKDRPPR
jgi:flagellar biosynthesis/type III secretory pathway M-ring protein FliF/YscJ